MSNSDPQQNIQKQSKVLFDLKECDELFQKDKSLKQTRDIKEIQRQIGEMKNKELNFYKNLRLDKQSKEKIFGIKFDNISQKNNQNPDDDQNDKQFNNIGSSDVNGKVIVQDPLQGNLIMTQQEYNNIYQRDPLNF